MRVDGKFFRHGDEKFFVRGVTYGPFAPNDLGDPFASPEQTERDFWLMKDLGANLIRVYQTPPRWLLDLAEQADLKVLIDIPVNKVSCFLELDACRAEANAKVNETVRACRHHSAVFAYLVVNEIPPDIVRWVGARTITERIEELIAQAKSADPDCLCSMANFPPTEYLRPRNQDFAAFNIYLHQRASFEKYLRRLQMQSEGKPLLLTEFGIDSWRESEERKSEMLSWHIESSFRAGLAGAVLFSFTDEWFAGGREVEDWSMGVTDRQRRPKASFAAVQKQYRLAPYFPLPRTPKVSVIVACYNGAKTLRACLDSLGRLNYPDYEIVLVDDGSTDATPQIASAYDHVRTISQRNHGLSVARNTGIESATGEILAFVDADCRADEDWLHYLVGDLLSSGYAGMGGPNLLPPEDSPVAAAVMVSPGGPAHVMLSDWDAEHIPGCNLAFFKWVLEEVGRFDPVFRRAGDDVDICWRVQQHGYRIGFSPSAFVWHYRRSTVRAYLKQQQGYGEAEALLEKKHPEYFNILGGSVWRGRIYTMAKLGVLSRRSVIYHGIFGTGNFQTLYTSGTSIPVMLCTTLEFHALVTLPLLVLSVPFHFLWPVPLTSFLLSVGVCVAAAWQADLPPARRRFWSRPLVGLLFFLQPITRGWARYRGRLTRHSIPRSALEAASRSAPMRAMNAESCISYWCERTLPRVRFIDAIVKQLDAQGWTSKTDAGWDNYDIEIFGNRWSRLQLTTVQEDLAGGQRVFRCRLLTHWSLAATMVFWSVLALELLLIGFLASHQPWLWMGLLSMPLLGWYWEQERKNLQWLVSRFLDELAGSLGLVKLPKEPGADAGSEISSPSAPIKVKVDSRS